MNLKYLFWFGINNFHKLGYSHGKYIKRFYKDLPNNPEEFANNQVETVIKAEKEKTKNKIDILNLEIEDSKSKIKEIEKKWEADKLKIKEEYSDKVQTLKNEKKREESCFETYSIELSEKAKTTNDMFVKLQEDIVEYVEKTKNYVNKQSEKIKNTYDNILWQTKDFILGDIKRDFLANKAKSEAEELKKEEKSHNWLYIFALLPLCIYDVVFWQQAVHSEMPGLWTTLSDKLWIWDRFWLMIEFIIAILLVVVWIISIHILMDETKKWWVNKQLSLVCIAIVILVFCWYAYTSVEDTAIKDWIWIKQLFFSDNLILIFRILIVPSLFVWDFILNKINTDTLFGRSKVAWLVRNLVNRWIFFFKKHWMSKYVEEERDRYVDVLEWLKKFPIPWVDEVLLQVEKVESKIIPISDELINKRKECDAKVKDIDSKIEDTLQEGEMKLKSIDNFYTEEYKKEDYLIKSKNAEINLLNEQLSKARISIREWFNEWFSE